MTRLARADYSRILALTHGALLGMRIGFDMISAGSGFAPAGGGMTTYYEGLLGGLCAQPSVGSVAAFLPPWTVHAELPRHGNLDLIRCTRLPERRIGRVFYEHGLLPRVARSAEVDVLLSTHNVKPWGWRGPSVIVMQSIQSFLLPDGTGRARKLYLDTAVPRSLHAADMVIAVSEAQRLDAITLFSLDPERIVSIHHGPSPWAVAAAARLDVERPARPIPGDAPYVVCVSSLYALKNHRRLIEAFALAVTENDLPHELVIAGRDADVTRADLAEVATGAGIGDRVRLTGPYPQQDLPALLANADAMAYVSLYETFGHPVLEAFAFGLPLVTSNVAGAAEVAGEAAEKADPQSVKSIAVALGRVLTSHRRRDELSNAGRHRLADFSWGRCASQTVEVLQRAIRTHQ